MPGPCDKCSGSNTYGSIYCTCVQEPDEMREVERAEMKSDPALRTVTVAEGRRRPYAAL